MQIELLFIHNIIYKYHHVLLADGFAQRIMCILGKVLFVRHFGTIT